MIARPLEEIAASLRLPADALEPIGWHQAKLAPNLERSLQDRPRGKYIGVTAISPTPAGEGKTVIAIGLAMALARLGRSAVATLRQPSLGPVFGVKGGGTGGGKCHLVPAEDINLHFTGDLHAVTTANNLLAALVDNHVKRCLSPIIALDSLSFRRAIDMNDKALGRIRAGLEGGLSGPERETGFDLTAASEVMAILAMAVDLEDLRHRVGAIRVGETTQGEPVTARDIGAVGAMLALLKNALRPNLVQTCEGTPALVHAGPFANIALGNSSVAADRIALRLAEFVITESGFGSDCGAEKLFHIKGPVAGQVPDAEVLVCTVRAIKWHSGRFGTKAPADLAARLARPDAEAVREGLPNLGAHLAILRRLGVPVVVAINLFGDEGEDEVRSIADYAIANGAYAVERAAVFAEGGAGGLDLARAVERAAGQRYQFTPVYEPAVPLVAKLRALATSLYGAADISLSAQAAAKVERLEREGFGHLPICVAKTQYSLSHDPALLGRPRGFVFPIRDLRLYAGAGYVTALAGDIVTLPGLPKVPSALRIDVTPEGRVTGLH